MLDRLWNFKDGGSKKVSFLAKNRHPPKDFFFFKFLRGMSVPKQIGRNFRK